MLLLPVVSSVLADAKIRARLEKLVPEFEIDSIAEMPVGGLFEVLMGPDMVYVSGNGKYMCWQQIELSGSVAHQLSALGTAADLRDRL